MALLQKQLPWLLKGVAVLKPVGVAVDPARVQFDVAVAVPDILRTKTKKVVVNDR